MSRFQIGVTLFMVFIVCWVIIMSVLPFLVNGFFYHVQTPVSIRQIKQDMIGVEIVRTARVTMPGECSVELQCEILYNLGGNPCPLEKGTTRFIRELPLPETAEGTCKYRGLVTYAPFAFLGPTFRYVWESEPFRVPSQQPQEDIQWLHP